MAISDISYKEQNFSLSYLLKNPHEKNAILFLHGWGSNKEVMQQAFGNSLFDFKHIYLDMPGFGQSVNYSTILTTDDYKNIVELFLNNINTQVDIVVGHSFGGKIATLLKPKCLTLLSSSGILVPKPFKTRVKIIIFKLLKPLITKKIKKLFVSSDAKEMNNAMYETFKNVVDEEFEDSFKNVDSKTLLFWGKEDTATPLWTAKKIQSHIKNSQLYLLDGDHFFFLQNSKFISDTITKEYKDLDE